MKIEQQAEFLEEMMEHIRVKSMHYMFDLTKEFSTFEVNERMDKLNHFIKWFISECQNDLVMPRGPDGLSYEQLRK